MGPGVDPTPLCKDQPTFISSIIVIMVIIMAIISSSSICTHKA